MWQDIVWVGLLMGSALYVFYKTHPHLLHPAVKTDAIFPLFVVQRMGPGFCGLAIAGVFAASMSSLDSSMHAITTATVTDFYRRFRPNHNDSRYLKLSRWLVFLVGILGTGIAMIMAYSGIVSLLDAFMTLLGLLGGGMAGIFLLGILTRRTHGGGAFLGAITSAIIVFAVQEYTSMHFLLFGAVGLVSCMLVGYLVSLVLPNGSKKDLSGLTVFASNAEVGKI